MKALELKKLALLLAVPLILGGVVACQSGEPAKPEVMITGPPNGTQVQVGQEVEVTSRATDAQGVTKVELYIGSDLYQTDGTPGGEPLKSWSLVQTWVPVGPGPHMLTVVAYNADGVASDPSAIAVQAVEGPPSEATGTPTSTAEATPTTDLGTPTGMDTPTLVQPTSTQPAPPPTQTEAPPPPPPTATSPPSPTPRPTGPDLYGTEFSLDPDPCIVGEQVVFRIVVRNGGNAPSGSFGLTVHLTVPPTQLPAFQSASLAPGEQREFSLPFTCPEVGPSTIVATIGLGEDTNQENNTSELAVNAQYPVGTAHSDLYVVAVSLNPMSPVVGQTVQVEVTISNQGIVNAGPHRAQWKSDPDTVACVWRVDGVGVGENVVKTCPYVYTYPHSGQSTYATVDVADEIDEVDEDNNTRYLRVNVRPAS